MKVCLIKNTVIFHYKGGIDVSPIEILRDPSLVQSMSLNQKLISGLQVALLGMLIVFFILFLLMVVLKVLEKLFYHQKIDLKENKLNLKFRDKESKKEDQTLDFEEEVAAITAAIMCLKSKDKKKKFRIKRITRVKDDVPIWGQRARGGQKQQNSKGELL